MRELAENAGSRVDFNMLDICIIWLFMIRLHLNKTKDFIAKIMDIQKLAKASVDQCLCI